MSVKYPRSIFDDSQIHLFYPCNDHGMLLVEVMRERRQKVVKIPPFLEKPNAELLNTLGGVSVQLKRPRGRHYCYAGRAGLCIKSPLTFKKLRSKWFNHEEQMPDKPSRFPALGNYAKVMTVHKGGEEVCRYVVIARSMATNIEKLNHLFAKQPEKVTIGFVSGDKKYLPTGYKVIDLKGFTGWVCSGFYLTDKGLYIEPHVYTVQPVSIREDRWEVTFKIPGRSGKFTLDSSSFPRLRYVAYRCESGLNIKVTDDYFYI